MRAIHGTINWCRLIIFLILFTDCRCGWGYHSHHPSSQESVLPGEKIVEYVNRNLPLEGSLRLDHSGYIYLKVTNRYVYELFPMLHLQGFQMPGSIRRHTKIGAHISVFYKDEGQSIGRIDEIGKVYGFVPKRVRQVRARGKEYVILEVDAPELEQLRKRYGLSSKLLGHEFHITLAEREK